MGKFGIDLGAIRFIAAQTLREWNSDNVPRLGASLAFYSMLSMGPLLLIVIAVAGLVFGEDNATRYLLHEISGLIGPRAAQALSAIIVGARHDNNGVLATVIGVATLIFSATVFFAQLQGALNTIWNVTPKRSGLWAIVRKRLLSFALIIGTGILLLFALVVSAVLAALGDMIARVVPPELLQAANLGVSFTVISLLFALAFKILPDIDIEWRDVVVGAVLTALLFTVGKLAIGLYLGHSALSSTYGAAGSVVIILIWVYYSSQIFFFGAELTQVHARYRGNGFRRDESGQPVNREKPAPRTQPNETSV